MKMLSLNLNRLFVLLFLSAPMMTPALQAQIDLPLAELSPDFTSAYASFLVINESSELETEFSPETKTVFTSECTLSKTDMMAIASTTQNQLTEIPTKPVMTNDIAKRESITFLLGETFNPKDPLYKEAFKHYCNHPRQRTEYVITHCRSILEVRNYLAKNPTSNGLPWGTINIVVQGDDWTGLNTSIYPQGKKATLRNMLAAIERHNFPSLSSPQVDLYSTLHLHGAKVDKEQRLVLSLSLLLFNKKQKDLTPKVATSTGIVYFEQLAKRN